MRGALTRLPGVQSVQVEAGKTEFAVAYDPTKADVAKMLDSLKAAGEPAKAK